MKPRAFTIRNASDMSQAVRALQETGWPCSVTIEKGKKRSAEQNRLQWLWMQEAEKQGDQSAEEYRGYCKLHYGVPILRAENEEFRDAYDRIVRPLPYEQKLELMMAPLDFPVTRLMNTDQKTRYLNLVHQHFTGLGFRLTEPSEYV